MQSSYFILGYQVDEVGIEDDLDAWNGPNFPSGKSCFNFLETVLIITVIHRTVLIVALFIRTAPTNHLFMELF